MKRIFILIVFYFTGNSIFCQTILPAESTEFCPNTETIFSVSIPGSNPSITPLFGAIVTQDPYNPGTSGGYTTFNFKGKFSDVNMTQILG